ncbi:MAG: PD-(D/E)XK nuclease family protein [Chloroflexi bacterium]|nr:PD-(D/E)XK nuclease family protein [Chloroflexota bacterium]
MPDVNAVLETIARERSADPLAPVTVVVPSHIAGLQLRRRLAELGPFAGVRFETLPRLAELLGAGHLAGEGRAPLARPIGDYLAGEVARDSQGAFARVSDLPGYARVLRQLFRRLRRGGVRGPQEVPQAEQGGHLGEIVRLYGRFRSETAAFYDDEDLLEAAAEAARSQPGQTARELGAIYVVPPGANSAGSAAFLEALRAAAPAYQELEEAPSDPDVRFVLAPDPASEAGEVVREVLIALERGVGWHEVAVFHGAAAGYGRLLREAFDAAGLPAVYLPGVPLIDTPAGRGVLAFAELPARDFSRTAVMDFLSVAPLRPWLPGRDADVQALSSFWDRLSREAGITHGLERWSAGLSAFVADCEEQMRSRLARENEARVRAVEFEREQAGTLREAVEVLAARLEPLLADQPAATFVAAFKRVVEEYFDRDARAMDEVLDEIDQLGTVGAVRGTFSLSGFTESLRANLELATTRERSLGDGVLVADYRLAGGLHFQHTILCGAYEGALPAGPGADALVADSAWMQLRRRLPYIEDAALRLERAKAAAHRAAASAGSGTLVWSSPLHEPGGVREYYPSHLMVEAARRKDAELTTASKLRRRPAAGWLRRGRSPLALQLAGPIAGLAELRLRDAISLRRGGGQVDERHGRWRPVTMLRSRRGTRFTEWDGNLATLGERSWLELQTAVSPTSLEHYAVCGFRYLCRSLLRLHTVDEPEERELMDAAARGTLIHRVLEAFFRQQQERGRPAPGEAWNDDDRTMLLSLAEEQLDEAKRRGLTGLAIYSEHEMRTIRADLAAFLEEDTAFRRRTGAVPAKFEADIPEVTIAGATLRGVVDRIDRTPDRKVAWVIDYKTGSKKEFEKITDKDDPFVGGTKLQLPTYVEAGRGAEEVHAAYWFITPKGEFSFIEYEPTPELQELFEGTVAAIVQGVRGGAFPAVSGPEDEFYGGYENCKFCDFDRICSRRRDDELAEKLGDSENRDLAHWLRVAAVARGERTP